MGLTNGNQNETRYIIPGFCMVRRIITGWDRGALIASIGILFLIHDWSLLAKLGHYCSIIILVI